MKVSAQYAQEHFADFLTAIDTGEEVELTRPGKSSVRLVLVESASARRSLQLASASSALASANVACPPLKSGRRWMPISATALSCRQARFEGPSGLRHSVQSVHLLPEQHP
jgi:antitoxin (DNA-binding transcriptional repressor) of toxin-antitoxin stability system